MLYGLGQLTHEERLALDLVELFESELRELGAEVAACAISVGAGLVAISIMSLYEYFRFGTGEGKTFEDWFKDLLKIPQADFALTATVTSITEAMGVSPVVTGIIICVFALYNVVDLVRAMIKTYNFEA